MVKGERVTTGGAYGDEFSDYFAEIAESSPYNAYTDRPSNLELVGDCAGLRVLDVGCGAGHYAEVLVERGAYVDGIEGSSRLLEHSRERLAEHLDTRVSLRHHDLEQPFDFVPDSTYDGVLVALVHHHVTARVQLLTELFRVLRPGGWMVLSTTHPTADWGMVGGSYYDQIRITRNRNHGIQTYWRQTLEGLVTELLTPGFVLERLVEPRPMPELAALDPKRYDRLLESPCFLGFRLRRPAT